jgi:hypothetical protein
MSRDPSPPESIPPARIVRAGGVRAAPPRPPSLALEQLRALLGVAIGLWPLTAVVVLLLGLLYLAGTSSAP